MQINQYANTAISVTDADWMDIDKNIGVGLFQSQRLSLPVLADSLASYLPPSENFALNDLTLPGNRFHDFADNSMTWDSVNVFQASATVTPGAGLSNFQFDGSGLTSSDVSFRVTSEGNPTFESYGDNSGRFYGDLVIDGGVGVGSPVDPLYKIYVNESGSAGGINMTVNSGTAGKFYSASNKGIDSIGGTYGAVIQNLSGSIAYVGATDYGIFAQGSNYGVYGDSPAGTGGFFTTTSGFALKTTGKIRHLSLPTTNAGLSTGDMYLSDPATIAANSDYTLAIKA